MRLGQLAAAEEDFAAASGACPEEGRYWHGRGIARWLRSSPLPLPPPGTSSSHTGPG